MAIRVARGVISHMREWRDSFALQIRGGADPDAVRRAFDRARPEIVRLGPGPNRALGLSAGDFAGPKYVSEVMPSAEGPLIILDASHCPDRYLKETLDIIVRQLGEAGVDDATISVPKLDERLIYRRAPAVVLHLAVGPADTLQCRPIPAEWILDGIGWVQQQEEIDEAWVSQAFPFPIDVGVAPQLFDRFRRQPSYTTLFAGRLWGRARAVGIAPLEGLFALGVAGTECSVAEFEAAASWLRQFARDRLPEFVFASLQTRPETFDDMPVLRLLERRFEDPDRGPPWSRMMTLCDEFLPDAFPWQILGPGHLQRLGNFPPGATPLADGYAELELAPTTLRLTDPEAFAQVRTTALNRLGSCLLSDEDVSAHRARRQQ